ncbi:MAG: tRNA (adenosine(37)-N6)-threonylcarbamoyltransferase complex transferase subunit TsaD [Alphaproteobacteria bacterium]|nr:tRNA (adenosine(37)-N6)-threonylcarbamoyltransferase complex transferase subunit TsaD [Alphaproteobacteria bacterium]
MDKQDAKAPIVMGIETSCDETAVAIVTGDKRILSHQILSQKEHEIYGGVVPEVAARAHLHHIDHMVEAALGEAGVSLPDLSGVAVTAGPGLIGGVMVGVMTAKAMAAVHDLPLVGVNHLEGHALTVRLVEDVAFPYLLLLVSGGHCQLLVVEGVGAYRRLGTTIDDAVGEAFDKTAKLLGLGYPGGPAVERAAAGCADVKAARKKFPLPLPLVGREGCDFSFSGLKTAVRRMVELRVQETPGAKDVPGLPEDDIAAMCASFQLTVADILCDRAGNAIAEYLKGDPAAPALVVAGGVAANKVLRAALEGLAEKNGLRFVAPPVKLCTDNGAMIAWAGVERLRLGLTDAPDFPVHARWPLDPDAPVASRKSERI